MKTLALIISLIITINVSAQWILQNPMPTGNQINTSELNSVFFIDTLTGWTVGSNPGIIANTEDGGKNWVELYNTEDFHFSDIQFIDHDLGWVIGRTNNFAHDEDNLGIILKSIDGGLSWDTLYYSSNGLCSIHFFNDTNGLVMGYNKILKTNNGGLSWEYVNTGIDTSSLISVTYSDPIFVNNETGWIRALWHDSFWTGLWAEFLIKTDDSGETWDSIPCGTGVESYHFIDQNNGWKTAHYIDDITIISYVDRTDNGGLDWTNLITSEDPAGIFNDIYFLDELRGWIVPDWLYSDDGGLTWESYTDESYAWRGQDIFFIDSLNGCVVGSESYIWTTNSGGIILGASEEVDKSDNRLISVYPNPTTNQLTVESSSEIEKIELINLVGKTVFEKQSASQSEKINTSELNPGIYFIRIKTEKEQVNRRVILSEK